MVVVSVSAEPMGRLVQTDGETAAKWEAQWEEETEVALGPVALKGFPERTDVAAATAVTVAKAANLVRGHQKMVAK